MDDYVITIEEEEGREGYYRVECPCGFFAVLGSPKYKGAVAYLNAKKEAKRHNLLFHKLIALNRNTSSFLLKFFLLLKENLQTIFLSRVELKAVISFTHQNTLLPIVLIRYCFL
jgi:hypothetical protein